MNFIQDPRIKVARKTFAVSWIFYGAFVLANMIFSYTLGIRPLIFGLPRWVFIGCILVPAIFVVLCIFIVEKLIPDVPLIDDENNKENDR